ncbi:methyltransferase [Carcinus maenas nudivirus]|uniref:Methyltransferase n=1 Tax=Carcinus maenas nudivirus TaxID=2880837 RepID=A0AAE8Y2H7_9VIRU|nr:methyltransferase [Carcinus maenas nudivirus]UBZ25592.1 methyltransferase [Carcinus maenas nudivirus]
MSSHDNSSSSSGTDTIADPAIDDGPFAHICDVPTTSSSELTKSEAAVLGRHKTSHCKFRLTSTDLINCGYRPIKLKDNVHIEHKISVKSKSSQKPMPDVVQEITTTKTDILKYLHCKEIRDTKKYCKTTVNNFDKVSSLIDRNIKYKSKLEADPALVDKNKKDLDSFQDVVFNREVLMNRASLKLSNLNYAFGNIIGKAMKNDMSFADLCCAPGGFTYYLLSVFPKYKINAYLTTMHNINTFLPMNESLFTLGCRANINLSYGDICSDEYRQEFKNSISNKVNFVLADGGFDFSGNENYQEYYSKNLYLAQMIMGMDIVRDGGFIICKFFDLYTTFSTTLMYVLSLMFDSITICKPISSKAGNSERYVLFKNFQYNRSIVDYLKHVLIRNMCGCQYEQLMVNSLVDEELLTYKTFLDSITKINKTIAMNQSSALQKYLGITKIINNTNNKNNAFSAFKLWHKLIKN